VLQSSVLQSSVLQSSGIPCKHCTSLSNILCPNSNHLQILHTCLDNRAVLVVVLEVVLAVVLELVLAV
jgi:hypothetical protein